MKIFPFFFLLFSLFLSACSSSVPVSDVPSRRDFSTVTVKKVEAPLVKAKPDIKIIAVGDIMLGTNYPDDRRAPDDGISLLNGMTPILRDADITFGNLEGVLIDGGESAKECENSSSCYVFRSPPYYAKYLKAAGFDVLSLANNHARDFSEEGRTATMLALDAVDLLHSGRIDDVAQWQVNGLTVIWVAYAPFGGSYDLLDIPLAKQQISEFSKRSDLVFVSIHAGAEGKEVSHIPFKNEMFYGEDRGDVVKFSHAVIDAGADLVIGHGPHVPRAMELYKNRLIAYSLGNFLTYWGIRITGENGIAPILKVTLSSNGEFKEGQIISARQYRPQGTLLDKKGEAAKIIQQLTKEDFPDTPIVFFKDGMFKSK